MRRDAHLPNVHVSQCGVHCKSVELAVNVTNIRTWNPLHRPGVSIEGQVSARDEQGEGLQRQFEDEPATHPHTEGELHVLGAIVENLGVIRPELEEERAGVADLLG